MTANCLPVYTIKHSVLDESARANVVGFICQVASKISWAILTLSSLCLEWALGPWRLLDDCLLAEGQSGVDMGGL
jgi:hypothetical protein